jgi:hypothetical protein
MSVIRPDFEALQDARAGNMRVRVMLVTSGSEIQAATALDISEYLEFGYEPTPITFTDAEREAPHLNAPIYLENGDLSRESTEDALARIDAELEAWEDMSTAARWVPPDDDETELPSTGVADWLEGVCDDLGLGLTQWQRSWLENFYAYPRGCEARPTRAGGVEILPSTDG